MGVVSRDASGIPHLRGSSADEVAYLQGRTAAQDRGWQIEVERWRCEGRLAEHVGVAEVGWDRFARRARLDDTARRCFAALDPETQAFVTAYVAGVNSALPRSTAPEFTATGTLPGRWPPWAPLGVFLVQHILFGTFPHKLWREHVAATIGATDLFDVAPLSSGSNAWAVAGSYVAGDPHRTLELPGVYQQVRLCCPEFDVYGFAFPGVPGLPHFGHAGEVAWAVTNAMADYQDLYREELRRVDSRLLVRCADRFEPAEVHVETILVAGGDPVEVEVVETPRGPLVDDDLGLRVPSRVEAEIGFAALLPMLRATNVHDVETALQHWVEPVNSYVVADRSGALVGLVAGRVPLRNPRNRQVPVPGWDLAYGWHGYAALPRADRTSLVNANDRREGDTAAYGVDFAPPHRARRVATLLADGAHPEAVHTDARAAPDPRHLLAGLAPGTAGGRALRDRLVAWNGEMEASSEEAGAYAAWRSALVARLTTHPDLRALCRPSFRDPLFAPWTDPAVRIGLALERLAPRYRDLAAAALDDVAAGPPPGTWGSRHRLTPVRVVDATTFDDAPELSGDTSSVLATSSLPGVSDRCGRGPVARYVWDLTDRARSRWVVPFGASGDPRSPHFLDQLPLWVRGELIPLVTDENEVSVHEYDEHLPDMGRVRLRRVDPDADAVLLHGFVTARHTGFWGMGAYTQEEVREVYAFLDSLTTHHAYVIELDDAPLGIFQTYDPLGDPVGERYDAQANDIGIHLLLAPGRRPPRGLAEALGPVLARFLFMNPTKDRIVVEPDVRNSAALRRLRRDGFTFGEEIALPQKRAQLAFLTRERFLAGRPAPPGEPAGTRSPV